MGAEPSIRVMVVDGSPIVRAGVCAMLDGAEGIDVVGTTDNLARTRQRCVDLDVDVLVTSPVGLLPAPGVGAGPGAHPFERPPGTRVVVLADRIDDLLASAVSASGVDACLHLATVTGDALSSAVRGVVQGQATFSSEFLPDLVQRRCDDRILIDLTARESDILELLARGHTNESIAQALGLAGGTVRIYVSGILAKLGTPNRTAAAVLAVQEGLVDLSPTPTLTQLG